MSFDKAFQITVGVEGGYVNDPADPGGETRYGISKRAHPDVDIKSPNAGSGQGTSICATIGSRRAATVCRSASGIWCLIVPCITALKPRSSCCSAR